MEELLLALDVARVLGLKTSSVYQLANDGVLPHVRIADGRRRPIIRFRRVDVEQFLTERTVARRDR